MIGEGEATLTEIIKTLISKNKGILKIEDLINVDGVAFSSDNRYYNRFTFDESLDDKKESKVKEVSKVVPIYRYNSRKYKKKTIEIFILLLYKNIRKIIRASGGIGIRASLRN